jgi:hypothetical protein
LYFCLKWLNEGNFTRTGKLNLVGANPPYRKAQLMF